MQTCAQTEIQACNADERRQKKELRISQYLLLRSLSLFRPVAHVTHLHSLSSLFTLLVTDADEEEEDEEDVEDGQYGEGEGGDDLAEGLDAAEDADDAEGAEHTDDAGGLVVDDGGDEGRADDKGVEEAPGVGDEGAQPVGECVDGELRGEEEREDEVEPLQLLRQLRVRAVVLHAVDVLRLEDGAHEILRAAVSFLERNTDTV
jgi:hypothetical protein